MTHSGRYIRIAEDGWGDRSPTCPGFSWGTSTTFGAGLPPGRDGGRRHPGGGRRHEADGFSPSPPSGEPYPRSRPGGGERVRARRRGGSDAPPRGTRRRVPHPRGGGPDRSHGGHLRSGLRGSDVPANPGDGLCRRGEGVRNGSGAGIRGGGGRGHRREDFRTGPRDEGRVRDRERTCGRGARRGVRRRERLRGRVRSPLGGVARRSADRGRKGPGGDGRSVSRRVRAGAVFPGKHDARRRCHPRRPFPGGTDRSREDGARGAVSVHPSRSHPHGRRYRGGAVHGGRGAKGEPDADRGPRGAGTREGDRGRGEVRPGGPRPARCLPAARDMRRRESP